MTENEDFLEENMDVEESIEEDFEPRSNKFNEFLKNNASILWFMTSLAVHAIFIFLAVLFSGDAPAPQVKITLNTKVSLQQEPEKFKVEPKITQDMKETSQEVNQDFTPVEPQVNEVVIKDAKISDHNETANEENFNASKGDQGTSDSPLENQFQNDDIGVGGGAGGMFGDRFGGRENLVRSGGGGAATEDAVNLGLQWLKKHQSADGYWDVDGFSGLCKEGTCTGHGDPQYDPAISGLALLCFLGAGHTTTQGNYQREVKNGIRYLTSIQNEDGSFGSCNTSKHMYNHAIATLAMTEAYALCSCNPILKSSAQKGIDYLLQAQTAGGGWRYTYQPGDDDTSVMGWCVMALKGAQTAGLSIPSSSYIGAKTFLDSVTTPSYTVAYRSVNGQMEFETPFFDLLNIFKLSNTYLSNLEKGIIGEYFKAEFAQKGYSLGENLSLEQNSFSEVTVGLGSSVGNKQIQGWRLIDATNQQKYLICFQNNELVVSKINKIFAVSPSMLAVSMTSRIFMQTNTKQDEYLVKGSEVLSKSLPQWGENEMGHCLINYYYWYYGGLSMYQMGGESWTSWNKQMKEVLLSRQEKHGCQRGSWPPEGRTCKAGGRIYSTALGILCLEIYYRYTKLLN